MGQDNIVKILQSAVSSDKLSHAYLFTGPKGVGKTSAARILAKMVNCPKGGGDNCDVCTSIADGSNLDLIEIDAASNRGIDDIREIKEKIKLSPTSLKKKVYIIDECHMLTAEAFNALLKTLEEPPSHVLFILATTEVGKLPQTILSRVTRLDFKEADGDNLKKVLQKIIQMEKLEVDNEALNLIIKASDGSFRDAEKLLDQLSSLGKKITISVVEENLKSGSFNSSLGILEQVCKGQVKEALEKLNQETAIGTNLREFLFLLTDLGRQMLLINQGVGEGIKKELSLEKYQKLEELAKEFDRDRLINLLNNFQTAYEQMKMTSIPELPLEIALIESSVLSHQSLDIEVKTEQIREKKLKDGELRVVEEAENLRVEEKEIKLPVTRVQPSASSDQSPASTSEDLVVLRDKWNYVLEVVRADNFSLEAMLRSVKLGTIENGVVILKVPYSFHQRILETPRNRDLLESVLSDVLGKPTKVGCVLEMRPVKVEELANVELAADDDVIRVAAEIFSSES